MTGFGAGAERVVDNGLDGPRATSAFGTAAEAAVELLGTARKIIRHADGMTDIVVAEDVTGADDHETAKEPWVMRRHRYVTPLRDAKGKAGF